MNIFFKFANTFLLNRRTFAKNNIFKICFKKNFSPEMGETVLNFDLNKSRTKKEFIF